MKRFSVVKGDGYFIIHDDMTLDELHALCPIWQKTVKSPMIPDSALAEKMACTYVIGTPIAINQLRKDNGLNE